MSTTNRSEQSERKQMEYAIVEPALQAETKWFDIIEKMLKVFSTSKLERPSNGEMRRKIPFDVI